MKKTILVLFAVMIAQITFAQAKHQNKFTPEQRAEIKTKKLTLSLDLTDAQANQMKNLQLELITQKEKRKLAKKENETLSNDEKYQHIIAVLDNKIAIKRRFQEILTPEQYKKWEKFRLYHKRENNKKYLKKESKKS